jgi:hypothetical protein
VIDGLIDAKYLVNMSIALMMAIPYHPKHKNPLKIWMYENGPFAKADTSAWLDIFMCMAE